jgi:hypothetical protein
MSRGICWARRVCASLPITVRSGCRFVFPASAFNRRHVDDLPIDQLDTIVARENAHLGDGVIGAGIEPAARPIDEAIKAMNSNQNPIRWPTSESLLSELVRRAGNSRLRAALGFHLAAGCGGPLPAADGRMIPAAQLSCGGTCLPTAHFRGNYGRAVKRIGDVLPKFDEATASLETL